MAQKEREARFRELTRRLEHEAQLAEVRERETLLREQAELQGQRELIALRTAACRGTSVPREAAQLEISLIEVQSRALVAERQALQPRLVEALTALGDKALLSEVARNMNLISLFRGNLGRSCVMCSAGPAARPPWKRHGGSGWRDAA